MRPIRILRIRLLSNLFCWCSHHCCWLLYLSFSPSPSSYVEAFAGGFGQTKRNSADKTKQQRAKQKKKTKTSILQDEDLVGVRTPSPPTTKPDDISDSAATETKLDKWGLPPPTLDDIFPPLPPDTEITPALKDEYTLNEIQDALKDHIQLLNLSKRFNDNGTEKLDPRADRQPMKLKLLHVSPPVLAIANYFTEKECIDVEQVAMPETKPSTASSELLRPVKVDSKTFALAQSTRTSTSWFCYYRQVPVLLAKTYHVLGIPYEQMEEPQIVRYKTGQEFSWHYDEVPPPQLSNGGQRLATLLVYLNTVKNGGGTVFRDLKDKEGNMLSMRPVRGYALLFFPAYANGKADDRTLHKGELAQDEKHIIQMWIHERSYQAIVPPDNSQNAAIDAIEKVSRKLGYI